MKQIKQQKHFETQCMQTQRKVIDTKHRQCAREETKRQGEKGPHDVKHWTEVVVPSAHGWREPSRCRGGPAVSCAVSPGEKPSGALFSELDTCWCYLPVLWLSPFQQILQKIHCTLSPPQRLGLANLTDSEWNTLRLREQMDDRGFLLQFYRTTLQCRQQHVNERETKEKAKENRNESRKNG